MLCCCPRKSREPDSDERNSLTAEELADQRAERAAAADRRQEIRLARGLSKGKRPAKTAYAVSDRVSSERASDSNAAPASKASYYD